MNRSVMNTSIKLSLFGIALTVLLPTQSARAACTASYWVYQNSVQSPPAARRSHAMAYDSFRGVTILFGGLDTNNAVLNDTWQYDAHGWKQLTPAHSPAPRFYHTLSYDASKGTIILFGGRDASYGYGDTWELDGSDWKSVDATNPPPARFAHGMTFDSMRGVHVLFGGIFSTDYSDTWEYDAHTRTWTMRSAFSPSARRGMSLAYDSFRSQTLLFGGYTATGTSLPDHYLNDTWTWDGFSGFWTQQYPRSVPQGRAFYALAYDSVRGVTLMQNGEVADTGLQGAYTATVRESWEWNGSDWSDVTSTLGNFCCPRRDGAMVYELAHQRMIQFAGDGFDPGATWTLQPFWIPRETLGVAWEHPPGTFRNQYQTVRQAVNAARDCTFINIHAGDYNETASGAVPLVITKSVNLDVYHLSGDAQRTVRIH
jgi:Galactose oxidase, central domain/Kelch motif